MSAIAWQRRPHLKARRSLRGKSCAVKGCGKGGQWVLFLLDVPDSRYCDKHRRELDDAWRSALGEPATMAVAPSDSSRVQGS